MLAILLQDARHLLEELIQRSHRLALLYKGLRRLFVGPFCLF